MRLIIRIIAALILLRRDLNIIVINHALSGIKHRDIIRLAFGVPSGIKGARMHVYLLMIWILNVPRDLEVLLNFLSAVRDILFTPVQLGRLLILKFALDALVFERHLVKGLVIKVLEVLFGHIGD